MIPSSPLLTKPKSHAHFFSAPILFYKPPTAIIGPNAPINIPRAAQPVSKHIPDYEVELTIVIGKAAKDVSEEEALDHVLGYTAANDVSKDHRNAVSYRSPTFLMELKVSFRFHQMNVSQWDFSKGFGKQAILLSLDLTGLISIHWPDNTTPIGPCLVAAFVIPDPQTLSLKTIVNGQVFQDGTTA